jgi:acetate kinase
MRDWKFNVLVFNPGSASLKFQIIESEPRCDTVVRGRKLLRGVVEPIGGRSKLVVFNGNEPELQQELKVSDHGQAAEKVLRFIDSGKFSAHGIARIRNIQIVGHRVVHGGERYAEPVRVNEKVITAVEQLEALAALHNAGASAVMRAAQAKLDKDTPAVAVFDTGFHRTIPTGPGSMQFLGILPVATEFGDMAFTGWSHNYLLLRYAELTGTLVEKANVISLHLEGGSSATAVVGGKSIDTSMGFTPLEGLVMRTRSGDIDPALVAFLAQKEKVDVAQ